MKTGHCDENGKCRTLIATLSSRYLSALDIILKHGSGSFIKISAATLVALLITPSIVQADACAGIKREMTYGRVAAEDAQDEADFLKAAEQFEAAVSKAPDCAQAYFNLGVVYEKAGEYDKALAAMKDYLRLAPDADDAAAVETMIFELEYRSQQQVEKEQNNEQILTALTTGKWCWERQYRAYGPGCSERRHNSGLALVKISISGNSFHMFID